MGTKITDVWLTFNADEDEDWEICIFVGFVDCGGR